MMLTLFILQSQSWGCDTDIFEPNNSQTQSTTMNDGTYTNLVVCEADDDWYSFEGQAEQVVDILIQFTDEEGDIDLQLYDPLGGELESSQTATDNEHIDSFQLPDDGLYWFRVKYYRSGTSDTPPYQNTYALTFSLTDEPYCKQDQWEVNDSAEQAVELPLGNNTLQACPYDEDWFAVYMNEGEELDVQATFDNDEGDLDIFLYKEDDLVGAVATGTSIDDNEELSYAATEEAMYYFKVALHNDMGVEEGNVYTLDVNFSGDLDFPEGQEPNEPNRDEEDEIEEDDSVNDDDQLNELDPSPEKSGCSHISTSSNQSLFVMLLTFCFMIRRKYHL